MSKETGNDILRWETIQTIIDVIRHSEKKEKIKIKRKGQRNRKLERNDIMYWETMPKETGNDIHRWETIQTIIDVI